MTLSDFAGWNGLFLLISLLIALVDVAKRIFPGMRKRVKPVLALLFGLGLSLYLGLVLGLAPLEQLWWGLVAGLGATGSYTLGKRLVPGIGAVRATSLGGDSANPGGSASSSDPAAVKAADRSARL